MKKLLATILCAGLLSINLACYADVEQSIDVSVNKIPLKSKLYNEYSAYQYIIRNGGDDDLNLVNAHINSVDSGLAYQTIADDNHPLQKLWLVCGTVGFFTLGVGWAVGLVLTPFVAVGSSFSNKKVRKESLAYSNFITTGYIKKGDCLNIKVLVPFGMRPQVKLTFKDKTNKIITITK